MLLVEVDIVATKILKGLRQRSFDLIRSAGGVVKLRGENNFVAPGADSSSQKTLRMAIAVRRSCIKEVNTPIERRMDHRGKSSIVRCGPACRLPRSDT